MTDREQLIATFNAIGVKIDERAPWDDPQEPRPESDVVISGSGYTDFYHLFEFDEVGRLVKHGSYE